MNLDIGRDLELLHQKCVQLEKDIVGRSFTPTDFEIRMRCLEDEYLKLIKSCINSHPPHPRLYDCISSLNKSGIYTIQHVSDTLESVFKSFLDEQLTDFYRFKKSREISYLSTLSACFLQKCFALLGLGLDESIISSISDRTSGLLHFKVDAYYQPFEPFNDGSDMNNVRSKYHPVLLQGNNQLHDSIPVKIANSLHDIVSHIDEYIHRTVVELLAQDIFDICVQYPSCQPLMEDIRACIIFFHRFGTSGTLSDKQTNSYRAITDMITDRMLQSMRLRILQFTSSTQSILQTSLKVISALKIVDPFETILEKVSNQIQTYLKSRPDSIRCIITSMTQDKTSELYQALTSSTPSMLDKKPLSSNSRLESEGKLNDLSLIDDAMLSEPLQLASSLVLLFLLSFQPEFEESSYSFSQQHPFVVFLSEEMRQSLFSIQYQGSSKYASTDGSLVDSFIQANINLVLEQKRSEQSSLWSPKAFNMPSSSSVSSNDFISFFIKVYGSSDLFLSEYRTLLAEMLYSNVIQRCDFSTVQESATLALLQRRFHDAALPLCNRMLMDIEKSNATNDKIRAIANRVKSRTTSVTSVDALLISREYWPNMATLLSKQSGSDSRRVPQPRTMSSNTSKEFQMHPKVESLMKEYCDSYKQLEKHKRIDLIGGGLGTLVLEVAVPDNGGSGSTGVREVSCSFGEASFFFALIDLVDQETSLSTSGGVTFKMLAESLSCSIAKILQFSKVWVSSNLLTVKRLAGKSEDESVVRFVSKGSAIEAGDSDDEDDEPSAQQLGGDKSDQVDEVTALYESYVLGMLSNLGALPVERIHGTLKMFASVGDYPYEASVAETTKLLGAMVKRDLIEVIGGTYKTK
jgi:Anaphase promoting complex (APC) subunit 2